MSPDARPWRRREWLALPLLAAMPAWGADFELVSAAEVQREAAAPTPPPRTRAMRPAGEAAVPTIEVIAPAQASAPLRSPLRIEMAFKAPAGARIVPSSFRLLYGVLKIDLTERVSPRAVIRESGVVVDGALVPDGTHRLIARIADDKGRIGEQELVIRVAAAR